jgi:uncharacterized membrane protein
MLGVLDKVKTYLWAFVEIGFVGILAILLVHLILGSQAGDFVGSVAKNLIDFANALETPSLVGIAIVIGLVYLVRRRLG